MLKKTQAKDEQLNEAIIRFDDSRIDIDNQLYAACIVYHLDRLTVNGDVSLRDTVAVNHAMLRKLQKRHWPIYAYHVCVGTIIGIKKQIFN